MSIASHRTGIVPASEVPAVARSAMAEIDRLAVEEFGITLLQMMEQAGSHLAEAARIELGGELAGRSLVVAAGPGGNGGGGLVAARHLLNRGAAVRVVLARPALRMSPAARHQLATLLAMGAACCVATFDLTDNDLRAALAGADLVIDALLGYGARGAPVGDIERLVRRIAGSGRPILSLDLPTGVDADTGAIADPALAPAATMTLALPKHGLLSAASSGRTGRLYLADIGLPAGLYARLGIDVSPIFSASRIIELDPRR